MYLNIGNIFFHVNRLILYFKESYYFQVDKSITLDHLLHKDSLTTFCKLCLAYGVRQFCLTISKLNNSAKHQVLKQKKQVCA